MSAGGSDGSDFGRFDLYSSIDARTEEFLRNSRKRQMKQGCVCAAIAIAITITVVISLILIYEYSAISETTKRTTLTPNWLRLMNTSIDELPFEVTLDKAKIGIDSATMKFLPLILKTLKKNKYFHKNIEDFSNSTTAHDRLENGDNGNYKNVFSDTRNWMKIPTRLYTIEYKTSPIVYFKNPTRNIDYYRKVRKIRDYQRIMNYVDKMISDRVAFSSTVPLSKTTYQVYKNPTMIQYTTPMTKTKSHITTKRNAHADTIKTESERKPNCNCPKRMSALLQKLITSLQNLLPNFTENSFHTTNKKPCSSMNTKLTETVSFNNETITVPKLILNLKNSTTTSRPHKRKESQTLSVPNNVKLTFISSTSSVPDLDYTLNHIIELLRPSIISRKRFNSRKTILDQTPNTKSYTTKTTLTPVFDGSTTLSTVDDNSLYLSPNTATTVAKYILEQKLSQTPTVSTRNTEYEDYFDTTSSLINKYAKQDLSKVDLVQNNVNRQEKSLNKDTSTINYDKNTNNNFLTQTTELIRTSTENSLITSWEVDEFKITSSTEVYIKSNNLTSTNQPMKDRLVVDQTTKLEDIMLEEELNNTSLDDVTPEDSVKYLEDVMKEINISDTKNDAKNDSSDLYEWELVKIEDYTSNYDIERSMIPQNRGSYLEIQRNGMDWKPEEHQDYNDNINNNLFD